MTIYHPNIPTANDDPSDSQLDLLDNFQKLNSDFSINHVPFTSGSNLGWHKMIQFFGVQTGGGSISGLNSNLYTKDEFGRAELFFKNASTTYQLTNLSVGNTSGDDYSIITPWGLIFNFGKHNFSSSGTTVTFDEPFTTIVYTVLATARDDNINTAVKSVTLTDFKGLADSTVSHYYLAIGV